MRVLYEDITEALVGRRLTAVSNTDAPLTREQGIFNDEYASDPPPIGFVAWNLLDGAIVLGVGQMQRGLPAPDGPLARDEVEARRQTHIDERPMTGYEREIGIGPGGWIEVLDD